MKLESSKVKIGDALIYNDGRPGHNSATCVVLSVSQNSMLVQFEDRADTTTIRFSDSAWINFLSPVQN